MPQRKKKKKGRKKIVVKTKEPSTTVLLKLVSGITGALYSVVQSPVRLGAKRSWWPMASNMGSRMKPSGVKMAQPSIAPPHETLKKQISAKIRTLCSDARGVRPRKAPRASPAATCPGVPSECSVLKIDW